MFILLKNNHYKPYSIYRFLLCLLLGIALSQSVLARDIAASVILAKGDVTATNHEGTSRAIKRGTKIYSGDSINTASNGSVQLRFIDKAIMTIKSDSELIISSYLFDQKNTEGKTHKALMKLVKGGFRTITGVIGKGTKSAYNVATPAATIGIRGTNYEVQQEQGNSFVMAVYDGGISVENDAGSINLGMNENYNFTRVSPGQAPVGLLIAPSSLNHNGADAEEETSEDANKEEAESEETEETEEIEQPVQEPSSEENNTEIVTNDNTSVNDAINKKSEGKTEQVATVEATSTESKTNNTTLEPSIFDNPYAGLNSVMNPFNSDVISDDILNLALSHKLGGVTMNLNYDLSDSGLPTFITQLQSPNHITTNNFIGFDFSASGQTAMLDFDYTVVDNQNNTSNNFSTTLYINNNVDDIQDLLAALEFELNYNSIPFSVEIMSDSHGDRLVFTPNTSGNDYVSHMEFDFLNTNQVPQQQLLAQMGGSSNDPNADWTWSLNTYVSLPDGSWDDDKQRPVFAFVSGSQSPGHDYQLTSASLITRTESNPVDTRSAFLNCIAGGEVCDIEVADVASSPHIKWGAWIASTGSPVTHSTYSSGSTSDYHDEHNLYIGLVAERAEISDLQGSASFSTRYTNCNDFSQCLGFSDDGLVKTVSGGFDVDFNNASISNGHLMVETEIDNQTQSVWQVEFNGHMYQDEYDNIAQPEFVSDTLTGSVHSAEGNLISDNVIGNVGGLFVNPGTAAAAGFNFATADESNKHTTGVFTLEED